MKAAALRWSHDRRTRCDRARVCRGARRAVRAAGDVRLSRRDVYQRQRTSGARHSRTAPACCRATSSTSTCRPSSTATSPTWANRSCSRPSHPARTRICRAVRHAVNEALRRVRAGRSLNVIGHTVQAGRRSATAIASSAISRATVWGARCTKNRATSRATTRGNARTLRSRHGADDRTVLYDRRRRLSARWTMAGR